jgi:hypothetical protein
LPVIHTNILIFKDKHFTVTFINTYGKVEVELHLFLEGVIGQLGCPAI